MRVWGLWGVIVATACGDAGVSAIASGRGGGDVSEGGERSGSEAGAPAGAPGDEQPDARTLPASCEAEAVSLQEVHSGRVRSNVPVRVGPLRMSSQKFLAAESQSGSCLWGAFAADLHTGEASGLLLVSFGESRRGGASCQSGTDGLPDDLSPGQLIEARGYVDSFVARACGRTVPARQLRVTAACPLVIKGAASPPTPIEMPLEVADRLARGDDLQLAERWGGALVKLDAVSALRDSSDGDAVLPFGVVRLAETLLPVRSRLYYFDLREGGPRSNRKAPHFEFPARFSSITGIVMLDYCDWALAPRDRCADMPLVEGACEVAGP